MEKTVIAGTIMLTMNDGTKKFLVNADKAELQFVYTELKPEMTGLASLLDELKTKVKIDPNSLVLLELTNGIIFNRNVPIFIFETNSETTAANVPSNYKWKSYEDIKSLIEKFEIEGMPKFN